MARRCTDLQLAAQPLCCSFHPTSPLLAVGLVSGRLHLYNVKDVPAPADDEQLPGQPTLKIDPFVVDQVNTVKAHLKGASCRALCFSDDGGHVVTGSSNHNLAATDCETGKVVVRYKDAHEDGVTAVRAVGKHLVTSGDEAGGLKLWDTRTRSAIYKYSKHTDFITDIALNPYMNCMVATSGDGTISIHDLGKMKALSRSEDDADDELLSAVVMKRGKKIVCGSQSGVLNLYSWGYFNDCSDRYPGHPMSVDALAAFDEDTLFTGSSDGVIRVVNVLPNKLLGIVGEHEDLPIEALALAGDKHMLASVSHDCLVKLWDLSDFLADSEGEESGSGEESDVDGDVDGNDAVVGHASDATSDDESDLDDLDENADDRGHNAAHLNGSDVGVGCPGELTQGLRSSAECDEPGGGLGSANAPTGSGRQVQEVSEGERGRGKALAGGNKTVDKDRTARGCVDRTSGDAGPSEGGGGAVGAGSRKGEKQVQARKGGGRERGKAAKLDLTKLQSRLQGGAEGGDDSDMDDSDSDDGGTRKNKRQKREKTKWSRASGRVQNASNNFFADLL